MSIKITTPTVLDIYSRIMMPGFDESTEIGASTGFLSLFGLTNGRTRVAPSSEEFEYEIQRGNERMSKWKPRGQDAESTGAAQKTLKLEKFTTIARIFPLIEDKSVITAAELNKRTFEEAAYAEISKEDRALLKARKYHEQHVLRQIRKMEFAASEAFRLGEQTVNEDGVEKLDFYRHADLTTALANPITDETNTDILGVLSGACSDLRSIGHLTARASIWSEDSFLALIDRTDVKALADNRRLAFHSIGKLDPGTMPAIPQYAEMVAGGMQWQGWIKVGSWELQIFTYIDGWETDAGVFTKFLPDDEFMVFAPQARRDRLFGPSELLPPDPAQEELFRSVFGIMPSAAVGLTLDGGIDNARIFDANMWHMSFTKDEDRAYKIKTQIAPVFVPVQTDSVSRFTGATS